ncbi:hypothetical protein BH11BAC3_BH11BAC3_06390 [soil metagenome]
MKKLLICIITILTSINAMAQYPPVLIPGSQTRRITSSIVNQQYDLQILLPAGYDNSTKKYPVVYLMDSQWDFPLVKSLYGEYYFDGFIPEMIIVGVTWGGLNANPDSLRARDYTPTNEKRLIQSGGADKFLSFMQEELFPFIESNYKASAENRSLMGCSLGGLFTVYTMLTHTEMFTGYAAASPAVGWDGTVLYQYEKTFASKKVTHPTRLYLTVGDVERSRPVFEKFAAQLINGKYPNVSIRSKVLENTGHSGTKSETYARGLQYIFEKPKLKLDVATIDKYTGIYQFQGGNTVEIKKENNQLACYFSPTFKYDLFAASDTEFYSTTEFFNIYFKKSGNQIEGLELERYDGKQFATKK